VLLRKHCPDHLASSPHSVSNTLRPPWVLLVRVNQAAGVLGGYLGTWVEGLCIGSPGYRWELCSSRPGGRLLGRGDTPLALGDSYLSNRALVGALLPNSVIRFYTYQRDCARPEKKADVRSWPGKRLLPRFLLTASVADHLESCNAQIAVLHFAGCFLNLPLFFFLILFTFCFAGSGAADCHLVANVLVKLNATAP
jgi:hypothetical protein